MIALALCRFIHFMSAMLAFGMSGYLWAYAPERLKLALSPIARRLALIASLVALVTAIAWLALESASMADEWSAATDPEAIGSVLTDTAFGHVWAAHLVLAAALVAVVVLESRRTLFVKSRLPPFRRALLARAPDGRRRRLSRVRCWRASASSATPRCRAAPKASCIARTTPSIS